jgi:hypothetical protein
MLHNGDWVIGWAHRPATASGRVVIFTKLGGHFSDEKGTDHFVGRR